MSLALGLGPRGVRRFHLFLESLHFSAGGGACGVHLRDGGLDICHLRGLRGKFVQLLLQCGCMVFLPPQGRAGLFQALLKFVARSVEGGVCLGGRLSALFGAG